MRGTIGTVGSLAIDTIETPAASRAGLLGGSAAYFAAAARHFTPVKVMAVVGSDFGSARFQCLQAMGVNTELIEVRQGLTYAWHGRYGADLGDAVTVTRTVGVAEGYVPRAPLSSHPVSTLFLANTAPVLQAHVLGHWPHGGLVGLDSRTAWIEESRELVSATAASSTVVLLNEFELTALTQESDPSRAAGCLLRDGAYAVVAKHGASGVTLHTRTATVSAPAISTTVTDPTGAGDAFAGGFLGFLTASEETTHSSVCLAMKHGLAMASFAIEDFGIGRLGQIDSTAIEARVAGVQLH